MLRREINKGCAILFLSVLSLLLVVIIPIQGQQPQGSNYRERLRDLGPTRQLSYTPLSTTQISTSGHSSGATAATHFYLSNSKYMDGIALFSSIHYMCGYGSLYTLMPCLRGRGNVSDSVDAAEKYAAIGLIDPLDALRDKRHYIFHGTQDAFINFDNGQRVAAFFKKYSKNVKFEQFDSIHSVPTKTCGIQCTGIPLTAGTGCSKCSFSVVFDGLNYINNGKLSESLATTCRSRYNNDGLTLVNQQEFINSVHANVSMLPEAILYTPRQCQVNSSLCSLHVAFHGCRHSIQNDGMDYIKCSGYLETADANNFIILFPQTKQSAVDPITLFHCWDLHGYTGQLYGTKMGSQNQVVYRMVSRIMFDEKIYQGHTNSNWNNEDYYYDNET